MKKVKRALKIHRIFMAQEFKRMMEYKGDFIKANRIRQARIFGMSNAGFCITDYLINVCQSLKKPFQSSLSRKRRT